MNICAPINAQYASIEALNTGREWFDEKMININKNRLLWIELLNDLNLPYGQSQGAYYICFDVSKMNQNAKKISLDLRNKEKLIINSVGDNYLRASFMQETEELNKGLDKLKKYFDENR